MSRPLREHDPEWFWRQRAVAALLKAVTLVAVGVGVGYGLMGWSLGTVLIGVGFLQLAIIAMR